MEESLLNKLLSHAKLNGRTSIAYSSLADSMQINITNGKHMWISDEPASYQGNDLGPNPVEMLMGSLAACTVVTILKKAKEAGISITAIGVVCGYTRLIDPTIPDSAVSPQKVRLVKSIMLPDISDETLVKRIKSFADNCPVESILTSELQIRTEFAEIVGN